MKTNSFLLVILMLACSTVYAGETKAGRRIDASAAFERLKTLVGEWEADTSMGKARLSYELIAGGTALVERETAEKMQPMLTVYHLNGTSLLLTHYCMAGNQPRMQARTYSPETGDLEFQFLDATNLASPNAGHMRNARFRFVNRQQLETEWELYENGQRKSTEAFRYTRIR